MSDTELLTERVLVLMPTARDSQRTTSLLREGGVSSVVCEDLSAICRELRKGAGALLLTEEAIVSDTSGQLPETLRDQPPWSAVPVIVIAPEGTTQRVERSRAESPRGWIVIERPVRTRTLLSVIVSALRGRRNQYQVRDAILLREAQASELRFQGDRLRSALAALQQSESELERQAEELRGADRRKDDFLAVLAHELRNPLAPLQTGLDLLESSRDDEAARQRALGVMRRQLRHMVRLIDDLLDVSRITRGKLELKRSRIRLSEAIDAALESSRPFIERGNHQLRVSIEDPALELDADLTRVAQVLSNLLNNASKYTPPGGLIEVLARRDGEHAVLEVSDNGIGIPQEHLAGVFEMFSQVNRAERSQGGLGIGLALVRTLVAMHGGSVSAWSEGPGAGSRFTVRLPLAASAASISPPKPASSSVAKAVKKRILVVDDNEDAAELLTLMLDMVGYETNKANDGPSGLAAVTTWSPDVVILDIGLPGMSGYEVARELRRDSKFGRLALVALSGWGSQEDKQKALDAGFDLHLTKPVDADALYSALAQLETRSAADPSSRLG